MFDPKMSAAAALAAFLLSFIVGVVSGAGFLIVLIRALVFAVAFFGLSAAAFALASRFLPELLDGSASEGEASEEDVGIGSRVDLSVGDERDDQGIAYAQEAEASDLVDDAESETVGSGGYEDGSEIPAGLDQGGEDGYTDRGIGSDSPGERVSPALPSGTLEDVDILPDLEGMTDSFVSTIAEEADAYASAPSGVSSSRESRVPDGSGGSFDARELASAIQTILKRDQKG